MKRIFLLFLFVLAAGCRQAPLQGGDWNPPVREALQELIRTVAAGEDASRAAAYAVFDFDNTTLIGDIELETLAYQITHLRFSIPPDAFYRTLLACVPNIDAPLEGLDAVSARMLATDLLNDYLYLYDHYIGAAEKEDLDAIRKTPDYADFRAKLWALSAAVDATFGYDVGCLWILRMYDGMDTREIAALVREAAVAGLERPRIDTETWTSPDLGEAGVVRTTVSLGLGLTPEMKELYRALQESGITVYICSASMEEVVAAVACDPAFGLELPRERVYGLRISGGQYAPGYPHSHHEGKVEVISKYIATRHGGADPLLVAGDSEGDYNMLTAFEGMQVGLLLNCGRKDDFGRFVENAQAPYVVQGRDLSRKQYLRSDKSK